MSVRTLGRVTAGYTYGAETELTAMVCPHEGCSITYAIPERLRSDAEREGGGKISWYCPNGHSVTYNGTSEEAAHMKAKHPEHACPPPE